MLSGWAVFLTPVVEGGWVSLGALAVAVSQQMSDAKRFRHAKSAEALHDDLTSVGKITFVSGRDENRLYVIFTAVGQPDLFAIEPDRLCIPLGLFYGAMLPGQELAGAPDGGGVKSQANMTGQATTPGMSDTVAADKNYIGVALEFAQGINDHGSFTEEEQTRHVGEGHTVTGVGSFDFIEGGKTEHDSGSIEDPTAHPIISLDCGDEARLMRIPVQVNAGRNLFLNSVRITRG